MKIDLPKNQFAVAKEFAQFDKKLGALGVPLNSDVLRKKVRFDKNEEHNVTINDIQLDSGSNLAGFPISLKMIKICIDEDVNQSTWQLAARLSEYNAQLVAENFMALCQILKTPPVGIYMYESEYVGLRSAVRWIPNEMKF